MMTTTETAADCGCNSKVILSGKPTPEAKAVNARQIMSHYSVKDAMGHDVRMDDLLLRRVGDAPSASSRGNDNNSNDDVSIVVFLRSLG